VAPNIAKDAEEQQVPPLRSPEKRRAALVPSKLGASGMAGFWLWRELLARRGGVGREKAAAGAAALHGLGRATEKWCEDLGKASGLKA